MFIRCGRGACGWSFIVGFASGVARRGGVLLVSFSLPGQGEGHQQKGTGSGPVINARQWIPIKTSKTVSTSKNPIKLTHQNKHSGQ